MGATKLTESIAGRVDPTTRKMFDDLQRVDELKHGRTTDSLFMTRIIRDLHKQTFPDQYGEAGFYRGEPKQGKS